jgi:hypothetical protein
VAGTCGYGEGLSDSINAANFLTSSRRTLLHGVSKCGESTEVYCIISFDSVSHFVIVMIELALIWNHNVVFRAARYW